MIKKQQIGFKACLDENKEESSNDIERNQITSEDLDDIIEERMDRVRDYEQHMNHYNTLCEKENNTKRIKHTLIIIILTLLATFGIKLFYNYAYNKGAYDQCNENNIYVKITDQNNNTHIIRK